MKGITRSRLTPAVDNAATIYEEAASLLDGVEKRPVRLVGVGIYNLSGEEGRQLTFDDIISNSREQRELILKQHLDRLSDHYKLDFAGNIEKLYQYDILHKTVEYMRKHF